MSARGVERRFWTGTHEPHWLARATVPLFVSRRRIERLGKLPRAVTPWALDSGGFTELQQFGTWRTTSRDYVAMVRRYVAEIGSLQWAAIQDWMCEPIVIKGGTIKRVAFVGTKLSVAEHQARTVRSLLDLRTAAPELPWAPVVQGWTVDDYLRCWEMYDRAGIDLSAEPIVGVGSVCRRQDSETAGRIFCALQPLRLHGFGLKTGGLERAGGLLHSADSMAWSYRGRMAGRCTHDRSPANCFGCAQDFGRAMQARFNDLVRPRRQADLWR